MEVSDRCAKIKERLSMYTLDSLDPFLHLAKGGTLPSSFDSEMKILDKDGENIASIWLKVTDSAVDIELLQRLSKKHKGVVRELLYLIICKAIDLDLPITFIAVPSCTRCTPGIVHNPEKLHKYYENIGFTAQNTSARKVRTYHTSVDTLKKIIQRSPSAEGGGEAEAEGEGRGGRRTRRSKRKKGTRTSGKYPLIKECRPLRHDPHRPTLLR
jgi:hypothetical protein